MDVGLFPVPDSPSLQAAQTLINGQINGAAPQA
jgi:hypothetical protein